MLPTFSLQRLPSLIHCLLTAGEGDWVFMPFTKCLAKALTNRCYQYLLEESGRGVEEGAKEKKDCGLVSRKRQSGLTASPQLASGIPFPLSRSLRGTTAMGT